MKIPLLAMLLLGFGSLEGAMADEAKTSSDPKRFYTEGGERDPFCRFVTNFRDFERCLDEIDKPSGNSIEQQDREKFDALELPADETAFIEFYKKSHFPPIAQAVAKPLFDAIINGGTKQLPPDLLKDMEHADTARLLEIEAFYRSLPFPTEKELTKYAHAWDVPGPHPSNPFGLR